jgi:hypothetical protein
MKSPFPGMDPYLEDRWSDVHVKLISYIGEAIQQRLPPDLRARSEERVLLESTQDEPPTGYRSDVAIVDTGLGQRGGGGVALADAGVAVEDACLVEVHFGPGVDRFIHIIDRTSGNRVVTAIEILSPWNKGAGRLNADYLRKLDDYARGGVSLVEIDLLRQPPRNRMHIRHDDLRPKYQAPWLVCIRRAWNLDYYQVFPLRLRQPLPRIPIPLRPTDKEVILELQPLIERIYVAGGHDDIDYSRPANPPLEGDDAVWADQLLKVAGKR